MEEFGSYVTNLVTSPESRKEAINEAHGNYDDLIRNYNYKHDLVGTFGYRPGETYIIDEDRKVTKDEGLDNDLPTNFDISSHKIENFTGWDEDQCLINHPLRGVYDKDGNIVPR